MMMLSEIYFISPPKTKFLRWHHHGETRLSRWDREATIGGVFKKGCFLKFRKIHRNFRAGAKGKNEMLSDLGGGGLASALDVQSFFIKENWICAMTRNHAEIFF